MPVTAEDMIHLHEFQIGGVSYVAKRMRPLAVINLARRLAPVLISLRAASVQAQEASAPEPTDAATPAAGGVVSGLMGAGVDRVQPILEAIAHLSDDDTNHIIAACLRVTQKKTRSAHSTLWRDETQGPSDDSLSAGDIMGIVGTVLAKVLGDLMNEMPGMNLPDAAAA